MANLNALRSTIDESGMKITALCDKAGINRAVLYNKLAGKGEFTVSEIQALSQNLHLTNEQRDRIFFADKVE